MAPTPSEDLRRTRAALLCRAELTGPPLRRALSEMYDSRLADLAADLPDGVALAAVGGLGRRDPAPYSDLDLVLLHDGRRRDVSGLAESIWYPIWDAGVGLDHSVRTAAEAIAVARTDLKALLGLLDLRHIAGTDRLTDEVRAGVLDLWRGSAAARVTELRESAAQRWAVAGEGAFLLEPNLKDSRGGLRDVRLLHALALAHLVDVPTTARAATVEMLDVRGELHRVVGHGEDVLRRQEHGPVGRALGRTGDEALRSVNQAARTIAHALDGALRRAAPRPAGRKRRFGTSASVPVRQGVARDVVVQDGEVVLARDARPRDDPGLLLRAARAAAEHALPLAAFTLDRLATEAAPVPEPWPDEVRADFVSLLGAGQPAVDVLESLDLAGLLTRLVPEWDAVRSTAQHNPVHRFTVDRHLLETAARAAERAASIDRPDLLLVAALLHDIGKGRPGDHSEVGANVASDIAARMGFTGADRATIVTLVRHHLLLPDTATRRDLDDPRTIATVADAVGGQADVLTLLHELAIADAAATGPAAWNDWKAGLVADLVARTRAVLRGVAPPAPAELDTRARDLAATGRLAVVVGEDEVVVAAPDRVGVLYRTAGVLALHLLDVRSATIRTHAGMAVNTFSVRPRFGRPPDPARLRTDLARVLDGDTGLAERLRAKERAYASAAPAGGPAPSVHWFDDQATDATVLEYRAADRIGLLCRVAAALERCRLDVRSARVSSLAGTVVDSFYVTMRDGALVPADVRREVELELRMV